MVEQRRILDGDFAEEFPVGSIDLMTERDMVQKIINISGKSLKVEHDLSKPSNKTAFCLDISKAQQELKWYPQIELEEGVQKTIKWYTNNIL